MDLRTTIGTLFTLLGATLALRGLLPAADDQALSLGLNVDLLWGTTLLLFGLAVLLLVGLHRRKGAKP